MQLPVVVQVMMTQTVLFDKVLQIVLICHKHIYMPTLGLTLLQGG